MGRGSPATALPTAALWAAAWTMLLVLPPAHEDDAVPLSSCCKVGKSMFWGHALGQATPGCPCQLLLAQGTAIVGTICFLWLLRCAGHRWAVTWAKCPSARSSSQGHQQQAGGGDGAPGSCPSPPPSQTRLSPSPGKPGGAQHPFPRLGCSRDLHLPALCRLPALPIPIPSPGCAHSGMVAGRAVPGTQYRVLPSKDHAGGLLVPRASPGRIRLGTRIPGVQGSE